MSEPTSNYTIYTRTVENILKPLRKKWKMKNYSLVIERIAYEWLQMKEERKGNPIVIGDEIKKLINDK